MKTGHGKKINLGFHLKSQTIIWLGAQAIFLAELYRVEIICPTPPRKGLG